MTALPGGALPRRGLRADRGLLLALALLALSLVLATPWMIWPYPHQAPWYESAALFPRVALALAALAALAEVVVRRRALQIGDSDELDSSAMRMPLGLGLLALFIAYSWVVPLLGYFSSTLLFLCACGWALRLTWRHTLLIALPMALLLWFVFVRVLKVAFGHGWLF